MSALGSFESGFNDALSLAGIGTQGLGNFSGAGSAGLFQSVAGSFGQQSNISQMLSEITNLLQQLQGMMANGSGGGSGGYGGATPGGSAPGESLSGLARSFFYAGARALIAVWETPPVPS